jgi:biotin operon repressor
VERHGSLYFRATCVSVWHLREYESAGKCRRKFRRKFRDERLSSRKTIHNLVNKLRTTGLLIDKKTKHERWVLTEKFHDVGASLEQAPRKLLKRLAQETGVSESSARTAIQLLKLRPYKTAVIHALQPCVSSSAVFVFAGGFYSLSSKVGSIRN